MVPPNSAQTTNPSPQSPALLTQADTINLENSDRIARFQRLAQTVGVAPPKVEQIYAPAGSVPGVPGAAPVVRVVFPEGVFFDTDSATPLPGAAKIIELIAQNMRRDVPDAALTILGHTDSTGTDAYNMDLSKRRALSVMAMLAVRRVDPQQMTTVAIGDRQPIAPNDTAEGRAMNRRVEFLISASPEANLAVVQNRSINSAYFSTGVVTAVSTTGTVGAAQVFQGQSVNLSGEQTVGLANLGGLQLPPPTANEAAAVTSKPLAPPPVVTIRPAAPVGMAPLSNLVMH